MYMARKTPDNEPKILKFQPKGSEPEKRPDADVVGRVFDVMDQMRALHASGNTVNPLVAVIRLVTEFRQEKIEGLRKGQAFHDAYQNNKELSLTTLLKILESGRDMWRRKPQYYLAIVELIEKKANRK